MAPSKPAGKGQQRSRASRGAVVAALALLGVAVSPLTFIPSAPQAAGPVGQDFASRRSILAAVAATTAASIQGGVAPARAAAQSAPDKLEVTGALGRRGPSVNGPWSIVADKRINDRAVYKKDGGNIYLMFNDCGQFQMGEEITNECKGFGFESDGKWSLEGKASKLKLKPVKKQAPQAAQESSGGGLPQLSAPKLPSVFGFDGSAPAPAPAPAPKKDEGLGINLGIQVPRFGPTGKESDMELLTMGQDVNEYIRAKSGGGGTSGFLASVMKLEDDEQQIADSLEARLAKRGGKMR